MRFVLVHGGMHGAWCWSRLVPELEHLGHQAIAIDLPGHGVRSDEESTWANRSAAILEALEPGGVLVGHSGGGYDITLAANVAPDLVQHLVYFASGIPLEGRPIIEAVGGITKRNKDGKLEVVRLKSDDTGMSKIVRKTSDGRMECFNFPGVWNYFYHDCDEKTARWAYSMLTPQPTGLALEPISVPQFWKADLPRSYVLCLQDRARSRASSEIEIERLGVVPLTIDTSHSAFLSRPRELANVLVKASETTPVGPLLPGTPR